jgi:hypothetical protein
VSGADGAARRVTWQPAELGSELGARLDSERERLRTRVLLSTRPSARAWTPTRSSGTDEEAEALGLSVDSDLGVGEAGGVVGVLDARLEVVAQAA